MLRIEDDDIDNQIEQAEALVPEIEKNIQNEEDKVNKGLSKKMAARRKRKSSQSSSTEPISADDEMKAVKDAGFLHPLADPEAMLARLGSPLSPAKGSRSDSARNDELAICATNRPSCASLGINQSLDDMLAVDKVSEFTLWRCCLSCLNCRQLKAHH